MGKVLLFDYDGVIVDSLASTHMIYNKLCTKYGCPVIKDREVFVRLFDKSAGKVFRNMGIPFWKLPFAFADYRLALKREERHTPLVEGIKPVMARLSKEHTIVVVTSNFANIVEDTLQKYKIEGVTSVLGSETSLSKVKKIHHVKKAFGRHRYYYIGDTKHDIIDGRAAGTKTVAVTWGYHSHNHLRDAHPDFIVDRPNGLLKVFR